MHAQTNSKTEMEIGAKLGDIIQNASARQELIENPSHVLTSVGAKSDVNILADAADLVHLVVPAQVDAARVRAEDETYFEELGLAALGSCFYEDLPE